MYDIIILGGGAAGLAAAAYAQSKQRAVLLIAEELGGRPAHSSSCTIRSAKKHCLAPRRFSCWRGGSCPVPERYCATA